MKRIVIYILLCGLLIFGILCYYQLACFVVYKVNKDNWIEVYRTIDHDKAMAKFRDLNNSGDAMYIFVDEETGNSILPDCVFGTY